MSRSDICYVTLQTTNAFTRREGGKRIEEGATKNPQLPKVCGVWVEGETNEAPFPYLKTSHGALQQRKRVHVPLPL